VTLALTLVPTLIAADGTREDLPLVALLGDRDLIATLIADAASPGGSKGTDCDPAFKSVAAASLADLGTEARITALADQRREAVPALAHSLIDGRADWSRDGAVPV
jgi:hypothetical protein